MNLKVLKDSELLDQLKNLVIQERELTTSILRHLEEVERRRLYWPKYSSLFDYCTLELGYSAASAQRRIASMRVVKTLPQIEEKIASGSLSLSNIAQAAKFFQNEAKNDKPLSNVEKLSVLQNLEGKSTREVEKELASRSSSPQVFLNQDTVRPIAENYSKVTFVAEQALLDDLQKIRMLLSHKFPHLSTAELITEMAKITLEKLESEKLAKLKKKDPCQKEESTSGAGNTVRLE